MEPLAPWGVSGIAVGDLWCPVLHSECPMRSGLLINRWDCGRVLRSAVRYPSTYNSNPGPASAAALLGYEDAATSAAGALDADSSGPDATAE